MNKLAVYSVQAAAACAASMFAVPAVLAQDAPSAQAAGLEEVTVTARRREESLQDVPIAVSAFSAERLENAGAPDITWLQQSTPNLTLQVARGSNSTLIAFIRGVGQQDPLWGFEPGVGLYVDDVYVARPQGAVLDIYDIERLEVLRGPQGTLYGRNTIGGAIKYVTKSLGNEAYLDTKLTLGTYAQHDFVASGVLPIGETLSVGGQRGHLPSRRLRREHLHGQAESLRQVGRRLPAERRLESDRHTELPSRGRLGRGQLARQARPPRSAGPGAGGGSRSCCRTCTTLAAVSATITACATRACR